MGCGACSKKAFGRRRAAPIEPSETECLRNDIPAVSSTCSPPKSEHSEKVCNNVRFYCNCQLVCLSAQSSHEALARHLADTMTKKLLASQRLFSVGAVVDSTRVKVTLIEDVDGSRPSCEVLVPLLTPEWLQESRSVSLLRHAQRHRALSLGPELLPLLHLTAFGKRPDALAHALNSQVGELLREVAAPGSWGRLENRTKPQAGIDAAASWLVSRIEALLCPVENSPRLLGTRGTPKSYRQPNRIATPPGQEYVSAQTSKMQTPERKQETWQQPSHRTAVDLDGPHTVILSSLSEDELKLSSSPKRPPNMPSLSRPVKEPNCVVGVPVSHDPNGSDLEGLLAAAIGEKHHGEPRRVPASLRTAAASSRPVTPSLQPHSHRNLHVAGEKETSEVEGHVRWASTTAWADLVRQECGSSHDPLQGLNPVSKGVVSLEEKLESAPIPTSAVQFVLPPQPRTPPRTSGGSPISLRGHWRRATPWRPHEGDVGTRPHSQSIGHTSGSSSAPPTPRGREEDWDHFNLRNDMYPARGEFCPAVTASNAFGDISPVAPNRTFVQSEPSSPRDTSCSWGIGDLARASFRQTCWGDTATWFQKNFGASRTDNWSKLENTLREDDAWDELDEVDDFLDDTDDQRVSSERTQSDHARNRAPLAPQGLPPLPSAEKVQRQKKTEGLASYANAFGGCGFHHETADEVPSLDSQSGRFVLGVPFPVLRNEHGGKRIAFGTKYISMDCSLNRKVVVWHFQVPHEACITEALGTRGAIASEIGKLRQVRHPRLCPYLGCELMQGELYVVTSYAPGGSVADWLQDAGLLEEAPTRRVVDAVLEGLQYLHSIVHMAHGGVRAGNVLLGPGAAVRLADFGLTSVLQRRGLSSAGMESSIEFRSCNYDSWRPPECAFDTSSGALVSTAGDIWSFAWLIIAMLAGFAIAAQVGSFSMDEARTPLLAEHLSPRACSMVRKCLRANPGERPSAMLLLGEPWLASAPKYRE